MKFIKHSELILLIISLFLGLGGTCLYAEHAGLPDPVRTEYAVWWGGLYPEYCLPGAMGTETDESPENAGKDGRDTENGQGAGDECVEIRFRYLKFLNP